MRLLAELQAYPRRPVRQRRDIGRFWTKLVWAGASVGRSGAATQAIAALDVALWDLKGEAGGPAAGQAARRVP